MAKQVTFDEAIQNLADAVITRALDDLFFGRAGIEKKRVKKNIQAQLSAFQFLTSDEYKIWADFAGRDLDTNMIWKSPDSVRKALLEYKK